MGKSTQEEAIQRLKKSKDKEALSDPNVVQPRYDPSMTKSTTTTSSKNTTKIIPNSDYHSDAYKEKEGHAFQEQVEYDSARKGKARGTKSGLMAAAKRKVAKA